MRWNQHEHESTRLYIHELVLIKTRGSVYLRVEGDSSDEINVLKAAQTLLPGHVPKTYGFIHRWRQDEIILKYKYVQLKFAGLIECYDRNILFS